MALLGLRITKQAQQLALLVLACSGLVCLSFYAGVLYQKNRGNNNQTRTDTLLGTRNITPITQPNADTGSQTGQRLVRGTVTDVTATTISVLNDLTNTAATYQLTSDTVVTGDGGTLDITAIHTGDVVMIRADEADASKVKQIIRNPTLGVDG